MVPASAVVSIFQHLVQLKATIKASLIRLMVATLQVWGKYDIKTINKEG
jgi:hypothetical protein